MRALLFLALLLSASGALAAPVHWLISDAVDSRTAYAEVEVDGVLRPACDRSTDSCLGVNAGGEPIVQHDVTDVVAAGGQPVIRARVCMPLRVCSDWSLDYRPNFTSLTPPAGFIIIMIDLEPNP